MARNVVLVLASLGVLVVLFLGYTWLVSTPADIAGQRGLGPIDKPAAEVAEPLKVGPDVALPGGRRIVFRRYDERSGQPTDLFSCKDWQPVAGKEDQVHVTEPELSMRLPSGMVATVLAGEGQLRGDRLERGEMRPRDGWLAGDVRIIIDRDTAADRTPREERPQDLITIHVNRLEFDLQRGKLTTTDRLTVESDEFDAAGEGLDLRWNQADNRVETLTIAHGEKFIFFSPAEFLETPRTASDANPDSQPAASETQPATSAPTSQPGKPDKAHRKPARAPVAYIATLTDNVTAEQYRRGQRVGSLSADEVHLLFDVGARGADRALRPRAATSPASSPTSRPERTSDNRFEVRWSGPLKLTPDETPPPPNARRLHFTAEGRPVVLTRKDGKLECGRVEYHDETQRAWLDPLPDQRLTMGLGDNLSAEAANIYVDRVKGIVKLIGPLDLRSRRAKTAGVERASIHAAEWGELKLAASARKSDRAANVDEMLDLDRLESARFVGDVDVLIDRQKLQSSRLDLTFRADAPDQTIESSLDGAVAYGDVRMAGSDGRIACDRLTLGFARGDKKEVFPKRMDALGSVRMERDRAHLTGDHIVGEFAAPPADLANAPDFVIRRIDIDGGAELLDQRNKVAARGEHIDAQFDGVNKLTTAVVRGTASVPGRVYAEPYGIWGERIDINRTAQLLQVEGPSRLAFRSDRSLQGDRRGDAVPVSVTADKLLRIDGFANQARFEGQVVAISGEESLRSDTMTLLLEDVKDAAPQTQPAAANRLPFDWTDVWDEGRRLIGLEPAARPGRDDALGVSADAGERVRKEPVRLIATNALMTSESFGDDPNTPVVHASISAPRLEVDIVGRQITTVGLTQLLMIDRRFTTDETAAQATGDTLGLPSALISRGPSQTAMQCTGRMTYALGPEGPGRRDTALFEDNVFFVHRAGKEMVNLKETLPQAAANPKLLDSMESRNASLECQRLECWFAVAEGPKVSRGGALTRTPLKLASLTASDHVNLRDQQDTRVREVVSEWINFDREQNRVEVRSPSGGVATVTLQDTRTNTFDTHTGKELVLNLRDGTVRSSEVTGEIRRP